MTMSLGVEILSVGVGGAVGGWARHRLSEFVAARAGEEFPWGTLVVNVSGALLLGVLAGLVLPPGGLHPLTEVWHFLAVGVLGSYTTVSSFSLQTMALLRSGEIVRAVWNVALSFALCLTAAGVGFAGGLLLRVG